MKDLLFGGIGWTDFAITLNRIAVGHSLCCRRYHKLFNAERHRSVVDELKALGVPRVGFNHLHTREPCLHLTNLDIENSGRETSRSNWPFGVGRMRILGHGD
jgi:hypothetical protein